MLDVKTASAALILFIAGGIGGYLLASKIVATSDPAVVSREGGAGYEFINPLLSCDISENTIYGGYESLKSSFARTISEAKSGSVARVSVYFRDLNSARWTGIEPDAVYTPASLNKLPVFISVLKLHALEDLKVKFLKLTAPDKNNVENFKPEHPLTLGTSYSLDALLRAMIEQSDNNAASALYDSVSTTTLNDVFYSFDVPESSTPTEEVVSPKMYGRFFRILYNASYLGRSKSQYALDVLANDDFSLGLRAAVPSDIKISHKFGERTLETNSGAILSNELHDCGIVYYPDAPYLLCVMTEGMGFPSLEKVIAEISKDAYGAVEAGLTTPPQH